MTVFCYRYWKLHRTLLQRIKRIPWSPTDPNCCDQLQARQLYCANVNPCVAGDWDETRGTVCTAYNRQQEKRCLLLGCHTDHSWLDVQYWYKLRDMSEYGKSHIFGNLGSYKSGLTRLEGTLTGVIHKVATLRLVLPSHGPHVESETLA